MSASVLEYLTSVLSQRGPTAVPYDENVKWNIRDHVSELQKVFPTLTSKLSEYHSDDGRLLHVLKVEGTMPIHYQGAKYNIPILMWLAERYPFSPPRVYVVPTANMVIRAGTFVNSSGQVSTPLLRSWLFPSSNLVDVVLEMSQHFGREPPLYTRPAGYTPPPAAQSPAVYPPPGYPQATPASSNGFGYPPPTGMTPYATPSSTPGTTGPPTSAGWLANAAVGGPYAGPPGALPPPPQPPPPPPGPFGFGGLFGGLFGGGQQLPPPPPPQQPQQPMPPPPPPSGGPSSNQLAVDAAGAAGAAAAATGAAAAAAAAEPPRPAVPREELEVHFRHLAIEALSAQLRALQHSFSEYAETETVKALEVQHQLNERRMQLQTQHDALTKERMGTEQLVSELASKTKALQAWLDRNEPKATKFDPSAISVASLMLPADELSRQGMETQARDLALEDTILALDKLLQTGQVPLDIYLKQVRALCRKQFFSRALGLKVAAVQQARPQLTNSSSNRYHTAPYPLAHGDGWAHGLHPPPPGESMLGGISGMGLGPGSLGPASLGPSSGPSSGLVATMNPLIGR